MAELRAIELAALAGFNCGNIEGNPDPTHPLRWKVAAVVMTALEAYATVLGKAELRLVELCASV